MEVRFFYCKNAWLAYEVTKILQTIQRCSPILR